MMISMLRALVLLSVIVWTVGCGSNPQQGGPIMEESGKEMGPSAEGARFILTAEPANAKDVLAARESVKDGEEVALVGRIGGSQKPMGPSAYFTVVDLSKEYCKEDGCDTPWDYCCTPDKELRSATTLVKFESAPGKTITTNAKALLGVKELDVVVVRGKAKRDGKGNLEVVGDGIFVRKRHDSPK